MICKHCGKSFEPTIHFKKYCSKECYKAVRMADARERSKARYKRDSEKLKEYFKEYRKNHLEYFKKYHREHYNRKTRNENINIEEV